MTQAAAGARLIVHADDFGLSEAVNRGVLAAHARGGSFCVLCDARRPDLIESWYSVMRVVRNCILRCRLQLLTWQELAAVLPKSLQKFLAGKYGITASRSEGTDIVWPKGAL